MQGLDAGKFGDQMAATFQLPRNNGLRLVGQLRDGEFFQFAQHSDGRRKKVHAPFKFGRRDLLVKQRGRFSQLHPKDLSLMLKRKETRDAVFRYPHDRARLSRRRAGAVGAGQPALDHFVLL